MTDTGLGILLGLALQQFVAELNDDLAERGFDTPAARGDVGAPSQQIDARARRNAGGDVGQRLRRQRRQVGGRDAEQRGDRGFAYARRAEIAFALLARAGQPRARLIEHVRRIDLVRNAKVGDMKVALQRRDEPRVVTKRRGKRLRRVALIEHQTRLLNLEAPEGGIAPIGGNGALAHLLFQCLYAPQQLLPGGRLDRELGHRGPLAVKLCVDARQGKQEQREGKPEFLHSERQDQGGL